MRKNERSRQKEREGEEEKDREAFTITNVLQVPGR